MTALAGVTSSLARGALLAALALVAGCHTPPRRPATPEVHGILYEAGKLEQELRGIQEAQDAFDLRCRVAALYLTLVEYPSAPRRERLDNARRALAHADAAILLEPDRVEGHFYRALGLGRVLEFSTVPDLSKIGLLDQAARRARDLDPDFQGAGPLRLLAVFYSQAPSWPIGPEEAGEDDVIDGLFREALERAPTCAENRVCYAEYLVEKHRVSEAAGHARAAQELLATDPLVGSSFERDDLQRRIEAILRL
ncbi:MAG: hypothetical protein M9894_12665 [Planctomycetes bacterium]|nr:hypothetical protein [Planctomycetota bacterium]